MLKCSWLFFICITWIDFLDLHVFPMPHNKLILQGILVSTNFQPRSPWVPSLQNKATHVPSPSVGNIQMKLEEINQKCAIEELEVSNKTKN
jgi:hypothetical protein